MPLDGIAHATHQQVAIRLPLDEIILSADPYCLRRRLLLAKSYQHDNRHVSCARTDLQTRLEALAVGKREIQQNHIEALSTQTLEHLAEWFDTHQLKLRGGSPLLVVLPGITLALGGPRHRATRGALMAAFHLQSHLIRESALAPE